MKKTFLLLELLIGMILLGTVALPLAHIPMKAIQHEINSCYNLRLPSVADETFALIKEKLYANEIPWDLLLKKQSEKALVMDDTIQIFLFQWGSRKFERKCFIHSYGKIDPNGNEVRLVKVIVELNKIPFLYDVLVCKPSMPDLI